MLLRVKMRFLLVFVLCIALERVYGFNVWTFPEESNCTTNCKPDDDSLFTTKKIRIGGGAFAMFMMSNPQNAAPNERYGPRRPGTGDDTHMCDRVTSVPSHLTFITRRYGYYYKKYTHAYQIPIVASPRVGDAAMKRACYLVRFLMADRKRLRRSMYKNYGRVGIIGQYEGTTDIPEHSWLGAGWNARARGLGGTLSIPISTGTEENLLCDQKTRGRYRDRYPREDIFLHEFTHGVQEVAVRGVGGIPGHFQRLEAAYNSAKRRGLWARTYAMSTVQEYFAEGTESYFNVNNHQPRPNGVHGPISTRAKLRNYDPALFRLIQEVFPCGNERVWLRCNYVHKPHLKMPPFKMNCDGDGPEILVTDGGPTKPVKPVTPAPATPPTELSCSNDNQHCDAWAAKDFCLPNSGYTKYMLRKCSLSCECCVNKDKRCDSWLSYCDDAEHAEYMYKNCKKTCKTCQKSMK